MSSQNQTPVGNGCSLEDCFTNLFALTDFGDIQYRKYKVQTEQPYVDPLEDPLLTAFTRCQENGLLSTWTRAKRDNSDPTRPHDMANFSKELWVFWYGEAEPTNLRGDLVSGLQELENGNWSTGLAYECRTMLFKALHNVVERCLMKKSFVRLGKWFVQPYRKTLNHCKSPQYSISFSFFLHGESTVCASLDVRQLPPVRYISAKHLDICNKEQIRIPVILAPYGLNAQLSGRYYCEDDPVTTKFLHRWLKFYPLKFEEHGVNPSAPPKFVEVIFGGYRMRYPSCFVLVSDADVPENVAEHDPVAPSRIPESMTHQRAKNIHAYMGDRAMQRVHQDACIPLKGCDQQFKDDEKPSNVSSIFSYNTPSCKADCRCRRTSHRRSIPDASLRRQKTLPFHQRDHSLVHVKERLEEVNANCDRNRSPPNLPVNDPTMPTLSPQPPTLEQQAAASGLASAPSAPIPASQSSGLSSSQFQTPASQETTSSIPLQSSDPSQQHLSMSSAMSPTVMYGLEALNAISSGACQSTETLMGNMDGLESLSTSAVASSTAQPAPNVQQTIVTTPIKWPPPGITELPIKDRSIQDHSSSTVPTLTRFEPTDGWLRQQELERRDLKRPALSISKIELCNAESWLDTEPYHISSKFPVNNDVGSPNSKFSRLHGQYDRDSSDTYDFNQDEPSGPRNSVVGGRGGKGSTYPWFPHNNGDSRLRPETLPDFNRASRGELLKSGPSPPDVIFDYEEEDDDPGTIPLTNHIPGASQGNVMGRTLPQQPSGKIGASIASSTGSGIIGSVELSRMLPTPPSLENQTLPSPVEQPQPCASLIPASVAAHHHPYAGNVVNTTHLANTSGPILCHHPLSLASYQQSDLMTETYEKEWVFVKPSSGVYIFGSKYSVPCRKGVTDLPNLYYDHRIVKNNIRNSTALPNLHVAPLPNQAPTSTSYHNSTNKEHRVPFSRQPYTPGGPVTPGSITGYPNVASIDSERGLSQTASIDASPALPASIQSQRSTHTPADFSPASTPGSLFNRTFGSNLDAQEAHFSNALGDNSTGCLLEAHSLYLNVILSDSMLNVFKDHNFDSCNICECSMSVQGGDVGLYLPGLPSKKQDSRKDCKCGFSALMNKRYVENGNLFFEDKEEVTGLHDTKPFTVFPSVWHTLLSPGDTSNRNGLDSCSQNTTAPDSLLPSPSVLAELYTQLVSVYDEYSVRFLLDWFRHVRTINPSIAQDNTMEYKDACAVCEAALVQACDAMDNTRMAKLDESTHVWNLLNNWFYMKIRAHLPDNQNDQIRLLKTVRPWLQEAIGATRLLESCYTVDGPLTWKDFHKLAGRGIDESCDPQPLPRLSVVYEREGMTVSPFAIKDWERLSLEPYSRPKDIAYAVVLPDHDMVCQEMNIYFRELSHAYESCKLGRHQTFSPRQSCGFIRLGSSHCDLSNDNYSLGGLGDWFSYLKGVQSVEEVVRMVQMYVRACRSQVVAVLRENHYVDMSQFPRRGKGNVGNLPDAGPELSESTEKSLGNGSGPLSTSMVAGGSESDVYLVVYLVNPFTLGADHSELHRLATQALFCCSQSISDGLPPEWKNRVTFQHLSLAEMLNKRTYSPRLKAMAFSTYAQTHRLIRPSLINANRTLTRMGPAGEKEEISRLNQASQERRVYSPPYILAKVSEPRLETQDRTSVLFCAYCLSEDQHWLLAACTDEQGALVEYTTINILVPDRHRRKKTSARRIGLSKLWDFLVGVVAQSVNPWRLVIGRIGRLGHGELMGWNGLLGRKNLARVNQQFRDQCSMCGVLSSAGQHLAMCSQKAPSIVSACLVSLELQSTIRVYPSAVRPEERASSGIQLTTPKDASATHILVFPTSTSASAQNDISGGGMEMVADFDIGDIDLGDLSQESMGMGMGMPFDILEFSSAFDRPPSPGLPDSMGGIIGGGVGQLGLVQPTGNVGDSNSTDPQDDGAYLMQQPLAMGFYISTASPGPLPSWFWSACPQASQECPSCFKAALHVQTSLTTQDDGAGGGLAGSSGPGGGSNKNTHLLDSTGTCDVLRFVLESYNALSWLTMDPSTNDRRSCLPLHVLCLLQLYHAQNAFL